MTSSYAQDVFDSLKDGYLELYPDYSAFSAELDARIVALNLPPDLEQRVRAQFSQINPMERLFLSDSSDDLKAFSAGSAGIGLDRVAHIVRGNFIGGWVKACAFITVTIVSGFCLTYPGLGLADSSESLGRWYEERRGALGAEYDKSDNKYGDDSSGKIKNYGFEQNIEKDFFGIGRAHSYLFTECCQELRGVVLNQAEITDKRASFKFISHDFNDDSVQDFVTKVESLSLCNNGLCPTYLFIQKAMGTFEMYRGPYIKGDGIAVSEEKNGLFYDLIVKTNVPGLCVWHWNDPPSEDFFVCVRGVPIQKTGEDK